MQEVVERFFAMVLAYYRAPQAHPAFVDMKMPAPGEFSRFLDCLARPEERLTPIARSLDCSVDELVAASYFYIHRLLFLGGKDHYRVLGLSANVDDGAIRRRYRLLISLFHPDRIAAGEQWEEQFVRRLNHAYGVLKRPEKRRAYDRERRRNRGTGKTPASKQQRQERGAGGKRPPRVVSPPAAPLEWLYRFRLLQRYPKPMVWLLILLLLAVGLLVFRNGSESATLVKPETAAATVADKVPASPPEASGK
ncbi:J domain-containing protein [Thiolapillus sp.]